MTVHASKNPSSINQGISDCLIGATLGASIGIVSSALVCVMGGLLTNDWGFAVKVFPVGLFFSAPLALAGALGGAEEILGRWDKYFVRTFPRVDRVLWFFARGFNAIWAIFVPIMWGYVFGSTPLLLIFAYVHYKGGSSAQAEQIELTPIPISIGVGLGLLTIVLFATEKRRAAIGDWFVLCVKQFGSGAVPLMLALLLIRKIAGLESFENSAIFGLAAVGGIAALLYRNRGAWKLDKIGGILNAIYRSFYAGYDLASNLGSRIWLLVAAAIDLSLSAAIAYGVWYVSTLKILPANYLGWVDIGGYGIALAIAYFALPFITEAFRFNVNKPPKDRQARSQKATYEKLRDAGIFEDR